MSRRSWSRCGPALLLCLACGTPAPADSASTGSGGAATSGGATAGSSNAFVAGGSAGIGNAAGVAGNAEGVVAGSSGAGAGQANAGTAGAGQLNTEKPPEGVPADYSLVYQQAFADKSSLSDLAFANPTEWRHDAAGFVESTGYTYQGVYRSPFSQAIVKSIQVTSFVMDAELLQTSPDGDAHRDMVLIWNFVNPNQFYYAHISTAHDDVAHNILIVNDADRKAISSSTTAGYAWGRDVWRRLRLVRDVADGSMSVYDRDGAATPILAAKDKTFSSGYVGFGSFDNTGKVRNVKVWAAVATPGGPTFYSPASPPPAAPLQTH